MQVPAMVLALATTSFAREACLEPKQPRQKGPVTPATAESYEEDQVHQEACNNVSCSRCRFEAGFAGRLRRGLHILRLSVPRFAVGPVEPHRVEEGRVDDFALVLGVQGIGAPTRDGIQCTQLLHVSSPEHG